MLAYSGGQGARKLLIVDDDPIAIQVIGRIVADLGTVRFALSGMKALELIEQERPDLILLDDRMPGMDGVHFCRAVRGMPDMDSVPVIFITSQSDDERELACFDAGAADFILKPPKAHIVRARVRTHLKFKAMADQLHDLAYVDALTGVRNRRYFDEMFPQACALAVRHGQPFSVLMIDVDHFKAYNDRYGHPQGDRCLAAVAGCAFDALPRQGDVLARYGGEEFVVALPSTDAAGAVTVAQRIVERVAACPIPLVDGPGYGEPVTVSIGVATLSPEEGALATAPQVLLSRADEALYDAKRAGRNTVRLTAART